MEISRLGGVELDLRIDHTSESQMISKSGLSHFAFENVLSPENFLPKTEKRSDNVLPKRKKFFSEMSCVVGSESGAEICLSDLRSLERINSVPLRHQFAAYLSDNKVQEREKKQNKNLFCLAFIRNIFCESFF